MRLRRFIFPLVLFAATMFVSSQSIAEALTRADVDAWLDGLVPNAMRAGDIAGGVVVVVKDGQVLTERGYGYADVAAKTPVDPRSTLFRPGSISKVFTWTAVMQLVEQGRIDLDVDINRYLDFKIPARDGKPLTMRHLMTHTAGFEESVKNLVGRVSAQPLGAYLKSWVPERIFAAGTVPAYSNYASALAGYIVARVSQEDFEGYIDRHIFGPLGMTRSTFRQPVPANLQPLLSTGYLRASEPAQYFEYIGPSPAGGLSSTGDDMARFMIAHLQNGQYGNARILSPQTAIDMHASQPKIYPALNGMGLGFYEHSRNGHRVIAHDGGTQFFHSDLHLFLDDGVGLFISLSSPGIDDAAAGLHDSLFHGFSDRYFPAAAIAPSAGVNHATAVEHARLMTGTWEQSRRSDSNILSLFSLFGSLSIVADDDGTISFPLPRHGVMRWREIAPFVWRDVNGQDKIQALVKEGRPTMMGFDIAPPAALMPVPAWRSPSWMLPALAIAVLSLLFAGLSWPVCALIRRRSGARLDYDKRAAIVHHSSRALALASALLMLAIIGTTIYMAGSYDRLSDGTDSWLLTLKVLGVLVFVAALLVSLCDLVVFWSTKRGWRRKLWSIALTLSGVMVLWTACVFHFTNFSSHY